jgi:hypothetical protein
VNSTISLGCVVSALTYPDVVSPSYAALLGTFVVYPLMLVVCHRLERSFLRFRSRSRNRSRLRFSTTDGSHVLPPGALFFLDRNGNEISPSHTRSSERRVVVFIGGTIWVAASAAKPR